MACECAGCGFKCSVTVKARAEHRSPACLLADGCSVTVQVSPVAGCTPAVPADVEGGPTRGISNRPCLRFSHLPPARSGCPFCKNAKGLLADVGADFTALELDTLGQEGKAIRAELAEVCGWEHGM